VAIADALCHFNIKRTVMIMPSSVIHGPFSRTFTMSTSFTKER